MVYLRLLGSPEIIVKQQNVSILKNKPMYLLLYMASLGSWIDREKLAFLFWSETSKQKSQQNLRRLLYRTKEFEYASNLEIEDTRLRWQVATDAAEFKRAIASQDWLKAVELYSGDFLEDIDPKAEAGFQAWLEQERADLKRVWQNAVHKQVESLEQQKKYAEATPLLYKLLQSEPLAEDVLQRYIVSSFLSGESANAIGAFESFKELLKKELDLDPLKETTNLVKQLKSSNSLYLASHKAQKDEQKQSIPLTVLRPPKLIGREKAISEIQRAHTPAIFVSGEAGVGKSRLMHELAPKAIFIDCQEGLQNIPYYPIIKLLRAMVAEGVKTPDLKQYTDDLARLVPEVAPHLTPGPAYPETGRGRLFEALTLYIEYIIDLKNVKGFSLGIDDLQWADSSTLEFLVYLATKATIPFLASYRIHEQTDNLKAAVKALNSAKLVTQVRLEPLKIDDIQDFLGSLMSQEKGPPIFSSWLAKGTGGNPMFMLETLKSLIEEGTLKANDSEWHTEIDELTKDYSELKIPNLIQDVIQKRFDLLKHETQRILQISSVINRGFKPEMIASISGFSEWSVLNALDEAEEAAIVSEDNFQHDLIRQAIYSQIPKSGLKLMHRKVAEALTGIVDTNMVAEHWYKADNLEQAYLCWSEGVKNLRIQGLYHEAIAILEKIMVLDFEDAQRWQLRNELAKYYKDVSEFHKVLNIIAPVLEQGPPLEKAVALNTWSAVLIHQGKIDEANRAIAEAQSHLAFVDSNKIYFEIQTTLGIIKHLDGEFELALKILMGVLEESRKTTSASFLSKAITNVAALLDQLGRHEEALPYHEEARKINENARDNSRTVDATLNLLYCYMDLNRTSEGIAIAESTLELGRYEGTDTLRNNLAAAYIELGNTTEAIKHYTILIEETSDPTMLCIAHARLATLYDDVNQSQQSLDQAINGLKFTELMVAHAIVLISVFKFGSHSQKLRVQPIFAALDVQALPNHLRTELEQF